MQLHFRMVGILRRTVIPSYFTVRNIALVSNNVQGVQHEIVGQCSNIGGRRKRRSIPDRRRGTRRFRERGRKRSRNKSMKMRIMELRTGWRMKITTRKMRNTIIISKTRTSQTTNITRLLEQWIISLRVRRFIQ